MIGNQNDSKMLGYQNDSKMIGFQNNRNGKMTTMINKVNTMTPRQNDLVVKNMLIHQFISYSHTSSKGIHQINV